METQEISVVLLRGVRRGRTEYAAGVTLPIPQLEYDRARPGIYALPGDIVDPVAEAAKAKAKRDEAERAEKLRRIELERAYKAQERERLAGWLKQHQSREEAAKAAKAEAEALIAERAKAKRARASAQG